MLNLKQLRFIEFTNTRKKAYEREIYELYKELKFMETCK